MEPLDDLHECNLSGCPNPMDLLLFAKGELPEEKEKIVNYYLDECDMCREFLKEQIEFINEQRSL